ncbi:response regulator [Afipia felis]|uniref:Response regulatory domain-containing protein n=2 Tax=Afipia felis TaxID=1035 RepID=A0ABN0IAF9_AFIFE|nr:response regulator [Afipia felis]EKS29902.1 hypothetical protein HMPREF9697_02430 [Afipia felis ATCC 53690]SUU78609.1 Probable transcriptional regulatory protein pdtaR [Afipia felis]SUU86674.1 Probable transcriptional regulatory protein pdtaR [Afipia felis]
MAHEPTTSYEKFPNLEQKTILIVEDEVLLRIPVAEFLRAGGFEVLEAANADEAIILLNSGVNCDLVLSDFQMPGTMDGVALARRLKIERPGLPVVLSSSDTTIARAAEAVAFIAKPYSLSDLNRLTNELLGLHHGKSSNE